MGNLSDETWITFCESLEWHHCQSAFQDWGALHEVYVRDASIADWDRLLREVPRWDFRYRHSRGEETLPIPTCAEECFVSEESAAATLLTLDIGNVELNCHFFAVEELELDYSPGDICDQQTLDGILKLMRLMGNLLAKSVFLSSEGEHDNPIFHYCPETRVFHYYTSTADQKSVHSSLCDWIGTLFRLSCRRRPV